MDNANLKPYVNLKGSKEEDSHIHNNYCFLLLRKKKEGKCRQYHLLINQKSRIMFISGLKNNPLWHIQKSPAVRNVSGFNPKRKSIIRTRNCTKYQSEYRNYYHNREPKEKRWNIWQNKKVNPIAEYKNSIQFEKIE
jgi:hypothetical protein